MAADDLSIEFANTISDNYSALRAKYAVSEKNSAMSDWRGPTWPRQRLTKHWSDGEPAELQSAAAIVFLHTDKFEEDLKEYLLDTGLGVERGQWFGLYPQLAWLYMCALADRLARQISLVPTTDQYDAHIESLGWTDKPFAAALLGLDPRAVTPAAKGQTEQVGLLALQLVVPSDLTSVPVGKIVQIRRHYAADFDAFYDEISNLAACLGNDLAEIHEPAVLAAYIDNEMQRRFVSPLAALQRVMRGAGIDTAIAATTTKFELPTSTAVLGGLLTHHPVVAAGGAIAFGTVSLLRSYHERRSQVQPSAASYLWRIDSTLSPDELLTRVLRKHL